MNSSPPLTQSIDENGVARLTFNRPGQRNALDASLWESLGHRLEQLAFNPDVRCLVITGAGEAFAAGGDLKTLLAELKDEAAAKAFRARLHRCFEAICHFPHPTIAAVNGPAIGGGLEIAISCDIRVAARTVRFGMPAARFGMVMAQADFARLANIVGIDRARFLTMTGEVIDADEGFRIGLVHELADSEKLEAAVARWQKRLAAMEPQAVRWFRKVSWAMEATPEQSELATFETDCLVRPELRRRIEEFLRK